jgi:phosphoesterase RecJ-like protein
MENTNIEIPEQYNIALLAEKIAPTSKKGGQRIIITSHANPDGDALGSSIGLQFLLESLGHTVSVMMPTELPNFLDWLPLYERVMVAETDGMRCAAMLNEADIIFCLDYNALNRVNEVGEWIGKSKAFKVMIDHHMLPQNFTDAHYWRTSASSTCELVYELIAQLGYKNLLSKDGLACLYVGILTDTGGFRHATSPNVFRIVAEMLEAGVDNNVLTDLVFNTYSAKRFSLLTYACSQKMDYDEALGIGIIVLDREAHEKWDIRRGDTEGIPNFALSIRLLRVVVLVTERKDGSIKLSMRSKGDFSVQEICRQYFNGGGHRNASGGSSFIPLAETLHKLKSALAKALTAEKY